MPVDNTYFIISSDKYIKKGEEIFNSYGRRSNKFLLIWYGFTHFNNKYDSVQFRLVDEEVEKRSGKMLIVRELTK